MPELAFASDPLVIRWTGKLLGKAKATARLDGEFLYILEQSIAPPPYRHVTGVA